MQDLHENNVPTEEVVGDPGPSIQISGELSADQQATREVARFDVARTWISIKKAEYADMRIAGIEDKEGEKAVKAAWQEIRNKRLAVANKHKEIKADYLVITRAVDKEKNDLTGLLEEIETPLKAELDRIQEEREAAKKQKEKEAQERLQARVVELLNNGVSFNGSFYTIGDTISIDVVALKEFSDDLYGKLLERVQKENAIILQAIAEKEEKERQEREEQERIRLENERKQKELEDEQQRILEERASMRMEYILDLGFTYDKSIDMYRYTAGPYSATIEYRCVGILSANEWSALKDTAKGICEECNRMADELKAEKEAEDRRMATLDKLADMGISLVGTQLQYTIAINSVYHIADVSLLDNQDASEFDAWMETVKAEIKRRTTEYQDAAKLEADRRERSAVHHNDMEHLGFYLAGNYYIMCSSWDVEMNYSVSLDDVEKATADEWKDILGAAIKFTKDLEVFDADKKRQDDEAKEAARISALSDVEKAREWLKRIAAVMAENPIVTSHPVDYAITNFDAGVENEVNEFIIALDNIEAES